MVDTTVRCCVRCGATLVKKPGPGRWPRYCSDSCNPHYRPPAQEASPRVCDHCGASFVRSARPQRNASRYCSELCRVNYWRARNPKLVAKHYEKQADRQKALTLARNADQSCAVCGESFSSRHPRKYCSDPCKFRAAHVARYARRKGARREPYDLADVLSGDRCGICAGGIDLSLSYPHPMSVSLDHIVPLSMGGDDVRENVQAAHLRCNQSKGGRFS